MIHFLNFHPGENRLLSIFPLFYKVYLRRIHSTECIKKNRAEKEIQLEERSRGRQNDQLLIT